MLFVTWPTSGTLKLLLFTYVQVCTQLRNLRFFVCLQKIAKIARSTIFRVHLRFFAVVSLVNRPSPYSDRWLIKWARLFSASVGLTYEQSAVKLVVWVLKSGTILYKTHAHISLLNLQHLRYERRRVVKYGVSVFVWIMHAHLSKADNRIKCKIGCVVWSSWWYGEFFFSVGVLLCGLTFWGI